jgi:hypothetical protein
MWLKIGSAKHVQPVAPKHMSMINAAKASKLTWGTTLLLSKNPKRNNMGGDSDQF